MLHTTLENDINSHKYIGKLLMFGMHKYQIDILKLMGKLQKC